MKKFLRENKCPLIGFAVVYVLGIIVLLCLKGIDRQERMKEPSLDVFSQESKVDWNEERVGANIRLKQTIHGTDGLTYRYVIKTDCPSWDYEDRYVTSAPLKWVDDDTAAVEVVIQDVRISYCGTVYADGQYYAVPILGDVASEDVPQSVWAENLMKQAYQSYLSRPRKLANVMTGIVFVLTVFTVIVVCYCVIFYDMAKRTEENDQVSEEKK